MGEAVLDSEHELSRLSKKERAPLEFLFHGLEAAIGHRSLYGAMVDAACGLRGVGAAPGLSPVEAWCCWSRRAERARVEQAREALLSLEPETVSVLYRFYGPRIAGVGFGGAFGDLDALAERTATAEALARAQTVALVDRRVEEVVARDKGSELDVARRRATFRRGLATSKLAVLPAEALRAALTVVPVAANDKLGSTKAEARQRTLVLKANRAALVARVRFEAEGMLATACAVYRTAVKEAA